MDGSNQPFEALEMLGRAFQFFKTMMFLFGIFFLYVIFRVQFLGEVVTLNPIEFHAAADFGPEISGKLARR